MTNPSLEEGSDNTSALSVPSNDLPKQESSYIDVEKYVQRSCFFLFNLIFVLIDWMSIQTQFQMINIRIIQQIKDKLLSYQIDFFRKKINHKFAV